MAKNDISVDEFVKTRGLPEFHPTVSLRQLLRQYAPNAKGFISYGFPSYKGNRILAAISPAKTYSSVTVSGKLWNSAKSHNENILRCSLDLSWI